jgi:predicted regulator of Ras-like GTPase activity (Roadblock/LC7/MglB family)
LQGLILEYEKGMVVVYGVTTTGLLAIGISEPNVLGKVRYYARRALPELARGM